jgi:methylmalonyl-CoA mutase N-terminal domain/subunit
VRLGRTRTLGGIETREAYGPADAANRDYARDLNDPGAYPYTRGAYPKMYRSRMWTLRNIVGYGAPEDTREGLQKALEAGSTGLNVVVDPLTTQNIDCDHPAFGPEVGLEGCSIPCARDAERLLEGIDLTKVDVAWHQAVMAYPMAAAVVVRRGQSLRDMQGSHMPDMLQQTLCGWGNDLVPAALAHGSTVDSVEFCAKNSPKWALGLPQGYDLRERGLSPAGEIAVGMAVVNQTIADLIARGMSVDEIAPRLAWVSTSDIDFFEEIAKFRALRRHWARTMKERFGATDPRSMRLRIACHTSGKSLVYRQPLNNLSRVAIQSLAALLGGVQSLEACTYDEPVCVPTHEARDLATRTQQILSHEAGVARTADPLGGSYYVEALTDQVEAAAIAMLEKIEAVGLVNAVASGMIEQMMDDFNLQAQKEMDSGERIVVGLNHFIPESEPPPKRFTFDPARTKAHVARFTAMKAERDTSAVQNRLRNLYATAKEGGNPMQGMIDALVADASVAEVWGAVRTAHGLTYDPYRTIECPFHLS